MPKGTVPRRGYKRPKARDRFSHRKFTAAKAIWYQQQIRFG